MFILVCYTISSAYNVKMENILCSSPNFCIICENIVSVVENGSFDQGCVGRFQMSVWDITDLVRIEFCGKNCMF